MGEWRERQLDRKARGSDARGCVEEEVACSTPSTSSIIGAAKAAQALQVVDADVPKQRNGYDCGIFLLEFVTSLVQGVGAEMLQELGTRSLHDWFDQEHVSHRRHELQRLACLLQQRAHSSGKGDVARLLDGEMRDTVTTAMTGRRAELQTHTGLKRRPCVTNGISSKARQSCPPKAMKTSQTESSAITALAVKASPSFRPGVEGNIGRRHSESE